MNKVMLQGRLVRDPEISPANADDPKRMRCVFQLAVKRDYKKTNGPDTDFFRCVAFGNQTSYLVRNGKKGGRILVEGRMEINTADNDNGSRSVYAQVIVEKMWSLDPRQAQSPPAGAPSYDPTSDPAYFAGIPDPSQVPFLNA